MCDTNANGGTHRSHEKATVPDTCIGGENASTSLDRHHYEGRNQEVRSGAVSR